MTKRELVEKLAEFPDDVDVFIRYNRLSKDGVTNSIYAERIYIITNKNDAYYNSLVINTP